MASQDRIDPSPRPLENRGIARTGHARIGDMVQPSPIARTYRLDASCRGRGSVFSATCRAARTCLHLNHGASTKPGAIHSFRMAKQHLRPLGLANRGCPRSRKSREPLLLLRGQHPRRPIHLSGHDHPRQESGKNHGHSRLFRHGIVGTFCSGGITGAVRFPSLQAKRRKCMSTDILAPNQPSAAPITTSASTWLPASPLSVKVAP